jgi:hypothetical protein
MVGMVLQMFSAPRPSADRTYDESLLVAIVRNACVAELYRAGSTARLCVPRAGRVELRSSR